MTVPIYLDGEPQNLEAAALDSLEWLRIMLEYIHVIRGQARNGDRLREDRGRLQRTIDALEGFVAGSKPLYRKTGEPDPEGWAVVVDAFEIDTTAPKTKKRRKGKQGSEGA